MPSFKRSGARVRLKWYGAKIMKGLEKEFYKRLRIVGARLERVTKQNLSIPGRTAGPSAPGEFPHLQTGDLRKSIFHEVVLARKVVILGTTMRHGLFLEIGTSKMAARPFLRKTVTEERAAIDKLFTKYIPDIPGAPKTSF